MTLFKGYNHRICIDVNKINDFLMNIKDVKLSEDKIPRNKTIINYQIGIYDNVNSFIGMIIYNNDYLEIDMKSDYGENVSNKYRILNASLFNKYTDKLFYSIKESSEWYFDVKDLVF